MAFIDELSYNCKTNKEKLQIMPNMIGFQSVLHGICHRLSTPNRKARIIADQQSQFNTTSGELSVFYRQIRAQPWELGPGLPVMDMKNMPGNRWSSTSLVRRAPDWNWLISICESFKRFMEGKELTRPLTWFIPAGIPLSPPACHWTRSANSLKRSWRPCRSNGGHCCKKGVNFRPGKVLRLRHRVPGFC